MRFGFGKKENKSESQPPSQKEKPNILRKSISQYVRPCPAPEDRKASTATDDSALGRRGTLITAEAGAGKSRSIDESRPRRGTLITDWQDLDKTHIIPQKPEQPPQPRERRLSRAAVHIDSGDHTKIEQLKRAQQEAQARAARRRSSIAMIDAPVVKEPLPEPTKLRRQSSSNRLRKYASHNLLRSKANSLNASKSMENVNAGKEIRVSDVPDVPPMPEKYAQEATRPSTTIDRPADKRQVEPVIARISVTGSASKTSEEKSPGASSSSNSSPSSDDGFGDLDLRGVTPLPPMPALESDLVPRPLTPPKATLSVEIPPPPLERQSSSRSIQSIISLRSSKTTNSENRGSRTPFISLTPASSIRSLSRRLTSSPPPHRKTESRDSKLNLTNSSDAKRLSEESMEFVCRGTPEEDFVPEVRLSNDNPVEQILKQTYVESRVEPRTYDEYSPRTIIDPLYKQQSENYAQDIEYDDPSPGQPTPGQQSADHYFQSHHYPDQYSPGHRSPGMYSAADRSPGHLSPRPYSIADQSPGHCSPTPQYTNDYSAVDRSPGHRSATPQTRDQCASGYFSKNHYSSGQFSEQSPGTASNTQLRPYSTAPTDYTMEEQVDEAYSPDEIDDTLYQQYAQSPSDYSPQSPRSEYGPGIIDNALQHKYTESRVVHSMPEHFYPNEVERRLPDDYIESPVDRFMHHQYPSIHQFSPIAPDTGALKESHHLEEHDLTPRPRSPSSGQRTPSPVQRALSLMRRTPSPARRSPSPGYRSPNPVERTRNSSPVQRTPSLRYRTPSPLQRMQTPSPRYRTPSPAQRTRTPSPRHRSTSPVQCTVMDKPTSLPEELRLPPIMLTARLNPEEVFQEVLARL